MGKTMKLTGLVLFAWLGMFPPVTSGQSSIFSGLSDYGSMEFVSSSRAAALGGAGIALDDSTAINFINPALLGGLRRTRISTGGLFSSQVMKDSYAEDAEGWAQLEYFGVAVALKKGLGLAFFLTPRSRIDYRYVWDVSLGGQTFTESEQGNGGLSRASMNIGWAFSKWGQIGAGVSTIFGQVEESSISYADVTGYTSYIEFLTTKQWLAFGGTAGLLLKPTSRLSLGMIFEPEIPLQLDKTFAYNLDDSTTSDEVEYRLAARYGVGLSYRPLPKWLVVSQMTFAPWSNLEDVPVSSYGYQDAYTFSAGAEWTPADVSADNLIARMQYRFGARFESGYALGEGGSSINGYFATFGIGHPIHKGRDRIDLSVEYGLRGDLSNNGGQESILKIRLGLNFGETWFVRAKPKWED
jgi:hypothetical protein